MFKSEMTAQDVVALVRLCERHAIEIWIDGGWAVDALLGVQTRPHSDLDIALDHKDVAKLRSLLEAQRYKDVPRDDTRDCNFVLGDEDGHLIDFHSFTFDADGNCIFGCAYPLQSLIGTGTIGGVTVKCIAAAYLVEFHTGYELREKDHQDVVALCEKFAIALPQQHQDFALKLKRNSCQPSI